MRVSLRWKIKLATSGLLIVLIGAMLVLVDRQAERIVNEGIAERLTQAQGRIQLIEQERLAGLRLNAQVVASYPSLKSLFDLQDAPTIKDFLGQYRRADGSLLMAFDSTGKVLARTDNLTEAVGDFEGRWMKPALENGSATGHLLTPAGVFAAAVVPASSNNIVFGFVLIGAPVNNAYALELKEKSNEDVVLAGETVLGSTLAVADLPWQAPADWGQAVRSAGKLQTVEVAGESYAALPFYLHEAEGPRLLAVILQSRAKALAPYRRIQTSLAILGVVILALGITGSEWLSRSVAAKLAKLEEGTARVTQGDFETPIEITKGLETEIRNLAVSFNGMLQGLRERAAIGKFVSQSTIAMIQRNPRGMAAEGQRIALTVFFSDIRGFTELTEKRAPEEVVKILNYCLSLQTNIVKKYAGDIDKFVGDCVVAHFYENENAKSAMSAIQCAIEIEKALEKFNATLAAGERIEVGIGLVTGEVVLGSIGSEDRRDFTAVGSNVNLASRLCAMAGPGEILLAESCYERVKDQVPAERLEPLAVKGFSKPVSVYRINVAARTPAEEFQAQKNL